jgi:phospholipid/cholesterol/gamma-HCH transport system substrate-binding protein
MAQRKQLTWTELRVGLFVLVGLSVLGAGIFYVTGPGFFGPKYRLNTYLPDVSGLANGATVSVDGVAVGNVVSIEFATRHPDQKAEKAQNIQVVLRIEEKFQKYILTDSTAALVTEGLLGNKYINVTRGFTGVPLKNGETVPAAKSVDVMAQLGEVSTSVSNLLDGIKNGKGTLGKLVNDPGAYDHLNGVLAKTDSLITGVQEGHGTLGKLVASDEMYAKVDQSLDNVNGMLADARAGKGTIGKLLTDPTLYDQAKQALANGNGMIDDARAGKGSLGKMLTDDTLYNKLRDTSANLSTATAKLNDNTTTAGKLFSDPALYDNLAGLTGDMRLLIGDFRQNPKKFLHIKVSLF